jgi:hypothetical protein
MYFTCDHIAVLNNWAETPFFLQLAHQLDPSEDMSTTVFQAKTEQLTYFKQEMITEIVHSIFYAVKARSLKYRNEVCLFLFLEAVYVYVAVMCVKFHQ